MNQNSLSWDLIAAFLAVIREGSLSGAARRLNAAQPTVRRQIEALEEAVGVALFTRGPSGLLPSATSLTLIPYAEEMEASAAAFARAASADPKSEEGTIRITCSEIYGVEILPPILAQLRRAYPRLALEVTATDRTEDLLKREADVAVRVVRPMQGSLIARQVDAIPLGFFATADFLATRPWPSSYEDIVENFDFISSDRDQTLARGLEILGMTHPKRLVYRSDSVLVQLAAIRAGIGIGICNVNIGNASGLVRLLPELTTNLECWVVMHEDMKRIRRIKMVFDHLVAALSKPRPLEGRS